MVAPDEIAARVAAVRARIEAAGGAGVRLLAAVKGAPPAVVDAVVRAGVHDVGGSYARELLATAAGLETRPTWHFIGRLQTNKVRALGGVVDVWQSVDRPRLVDELARRVPGARILVQVDVTGDPARGGCDSARVPELVELATGSGLVVLGLMAGPTVVGSGRAPFRALAGLADRLGLAERCMGMSDDLEDAVAEGATMVRVGRAIVG